MGAYRLMVTSVPQRKRNMLRLTAKASQFGEPIHPQSRRYIPRRMISQSPGAHAYSGRRTFTSWLIENAGTLPLKRKKEDPNADNSHVMEKLVDVRLVLCSSFLRQRSA